MKPLNASPLTASDFYKYVTCPHWPWLDRFASRKERAMKRALTSGEERRLDDGYRHEQTVMEGMMRGRAVEVLATEGDPGALFQETLRAMQEGAEVIYQGTIIHDDWHGRPDLLVKEAGTSKFGNWHYVPVDIKSAHDLKLSHRLQLVFYGHLLEQVQGRAPERGAIINGDRQWLWLELAGSEPEFQEVLQALQRVRAGERPPCVLRKACMDTSPWGAVCTHQAEEANDIALLYNVNVKNLVALRSLGIHTVQDAAEMDVARLAGAAPGLTTHGLEVAKLQARSLRDHTVFVKDPTTLPESAFEIYFDIESDQPNDMDYLYGMLIRQNGQATYRPFLAERPEDEGQMWQAFLAWLATLPAEYTVYHYAPYEPMRLRLLSERHGGSPWLDRFMERLVDLKPIATKRVTFPFYFYGLKYICKFLGFHWTGALQSGGESIDWYERWCETGNRDVLNGIIQYNEDDVRATLFLKDWLATYAKEPTSYDLPYPWMKGG
jgi:predicted RecB family nuclease